MTGETRWTKYKRRLKEAIEAHGWERMDRALYGDVRFRHKTARCCICDGPITMEIVSGESRYANRLMQPEKFAVCDGCVAKWLCRAAVVRHAHVQDDRYGIRDDERAERVERIAAKIAEREGIDWFEGGEEAELLRRKAVRAEVYDRINAFRQQFPTASWRQIYARVPNHYSSPRSMNSSYCDEKRARRKRTVAT